MTFVGWLVIVTSLLYLASTIAFMAYLVRFRDRSMRWGRLLLLCAWGVHGIALGAHIAMGEHQFGGVATEVLFAAAFALVGAYFVVGLKRPIHIAGAFLAPVVTVLIYSVWEGARQAGTVHEQVVSVITPLHIVASTLGVIAFTVAFVGSVLYIVQEHNIKKRRSLLVSGRIPPLGKLERASHRAIMVGFPIYTVGIVLGAVWVGKSSSGGLPPQYVLAVTSWVIYGLLLHSRLTIGWKGRRAAVLTIIGFLSSLSVVLIYMTRTIA